MRGRASHSPARNCRCGGFWCKLKKQKARCQPRPIQHESAPHRAATLARTRSRCHHDLSLHRGISPARKAKSRIQVQRYLRESSILFTRLSISERLERICAKPERISLARRFRKPFCSSMRTLAFSYSVTPAGAPHPERELQRACGKELAA